MGSKKDLDEALRSQGEKIQTTPDPGLDKARNGRHPQMPEEPSEDDDDENAPSTDPFSST